MNRIGKNFVKRHSFGALLAAWLMAAACSPAANAQDSAPAANSQDLATLVGPIALYPDDLIAIILPASTYPVQIVEAARFEDQHEKNRSLQPDPSWDDTVVALLNYPEVLHMMSANLNWTTSLGQAVLDSQADVMNAIQAFRDRAYAAGNLRSNAHQSVIRDADGTIEIQPTNPEVVYIPYYVPQRAVVYETVPVVHYFAHPFPLYYYPYPAGYSFSVNFFWGVTSAFSISWRTHALDYCAPSYRGHPYHGRRYYAPYYVRRDRDDLRIDAREHAWHSGRHRAAGPERRASYVARSVTEHQPRVDSGHFNFAGNRGGTAAVQRHRDAATSTSGRRGGSNFGSYRRFDGAGELHGSGRQNSRRPQTPAFSAYNSFTRRGAVRTEQPPHRPSMHRPVHRPSMHRPSMHRPVYMAPTYAGRAPVARFAGPRRAHVVRGRSSASRPAARPTQSRAGQARSRHGGRRTQRR